MTDFDVHNTVIGESQEHLESHVLEEGELSDNSGLDTETQNVQASSFPAEQDTSFGQVVEAEGAEEAATADTGLLAENTEELLSEEELSDEEQEMGSELEAGEYEQEDDVPLPENAAAGDNQEPEIVDVDSDEPSAGLVIELDSEDEIDNLEDVPPSNMGSPTGGNDYSNGFEAADIAQMAQANQEDDPTGLQESDGSEADFSASDIEEMSSASFHQQTSEARLKPGPNPQYNGGVEHAEHATEHSAESGTSPHQSLPNAKRSRSAELDLPELWETFPVFVTIAGDEYLLVPHRQKSAELENTISLFSYDEVAGCTLERLCELLRGNGDLIDAYNFNPADELCLEIPELALSFTEDNVHLPSIEFNDILRCFLRLSENTDGAAPQQMTLVVSMRTRFVTELRNVFDMAEQGDSFPELQATREHKRRKLDS